MKKVLIATMAALVAIAAPATAQTSFSGPRVEATAGVEDVINARETSDVIYGLNAGIDAPVSFNPNVRVGVEVTTDQIFDRDRDIGANVRLGYVFNDKYMLYGKAGYANYRNINAFNKGRELEGFRVGGGVEYALTPNLYTKVEYKYSDFEGKAGKHGVAAGVGFRF
jgi:outer membrane immunogenic protein